MQNLISLPSPTSDIKELKDFSDGVENYIRGLESMGQSYESYRSLLVPTILNKIPHRLRKTWYVPMGVTMGLYRKFWKLLKTRLRSKKLTDQLIHIVQYKS